MKIAGWVNQQIWKTMRPELREAAADAYRPIVQGFLLPGSLYYVFVTWGHWKDEAGSNLLLLGGLSLTTALCYHWMRAHLLAKSKTSLLMLELAGLNANILIYLNVVAYLLIHFDEARLIYFVLMTIVFAMSGVTLRTTLLSVGLALGTLYAFASGLAPGKFNQFVFIGIAATFASFGMAALLRKAILRQVEARLLANDLARRAQHLADHDTLTGLASRRSVLARLEELVERGQPCWLGVLDLDGFKSVNDSYGHIVGDQLLCLIAERMAGFSDQGFEIGRLAGDEFSIICTRNETPASLQGLADRLIDVISAPCQLAMLQVKVGASAGFAQFPSMAANAGELYEKADFALYRAKQTARGRTLIFDKGEQRAIDELSALQAALREADLEGEIGLVFQPQVKVGENRICGFEALARWQSPVLGAVRPDKFIRAAETCGLIQAITRILFRKGLAALVTWPDNVTLSFNLSAQDVSDRAFIFSLASEVYEAGIAPDRVEFEITETAVMADIGASRQLLADLASAGFKIALDDFGSGYSSFGYIDQLPLDKLKIDKSIVQKISDSSVSLAIVAGIIGLCRTIDIDCVLEGVETEAEMRMLEPLGPDIIQGFLFGRPMPLDQATQLIRDFETRGRTARMPS